MGGSGSIEMHRALNLQSSVSHTKLECVSAPWAVVKSCVFRCLSGQERDLWAGSETSLFGDGGSAQPRPPRTERVCQGPGLTQHYARNRQHLRTM